MAENGKALSVIRHLGSIVGYDDLTSSRFVPSRRPVILTYRQKLRPTRAQHRLLDARLERQRQLYNAALQEHRDAWRLAKTPITRRDQQKSLTVIRADDPQGHGADPVTMGRWTLARVEDAFTGFFSRVKPLSLRRHCCACGVDLHRDHNAARVMLARGLATLAATGEAAPPGTPTWADTPCVVPEPSPLPMGSAGDETSFGVINPE